MAANSVQYTMKMIIFFFKCFFSLTFLMLYHIKVSAQHWSEPVILSKGGFNTGNSFAIDKDGIIHCVWSHMIQDKLYQIYYTKSADNGATWTYPAHISSNNQYWLGNPHIVADTDKNLFVSYDYNLENEAQTKIYYRKFSNSSWSPQYLLSEGMPGADFNVLAIDHDNRLYCFWYYGRENGHFFYRYLVNDTTWSRIVDPFSWSNDTYSIKKIIVDKENRLHCMGFYHSELESVYRYHAMYLNYSDGAWSPVFELSDNTTWWGLGIDLKSNGLPVFTWGQLTSDTVPWVVGTYFAEYENGSTTESELITENATNQSIVVDINDHPHIVDVENFDNGFQLVHYYDYGSGWHREVVEQNIYGYAQNNLISFGTTLYWVYLKSDSTYFIGGIPNSATVFRKLDIISGTIESEKYDELRIFPNPFTNMLIIEFPTPISNKVHLQINDMYGCLIYTNDIHPGANKYTWDGKNNQGKEVKYGCYLIQILTDKRTINKAIIRI